MYLSLSSKPVGVDCIAIDFSHLILFKGDLHPITNLTQDRDFWTILHGDFTPVKGIMQRQLMNGLK